MLPPDDLSNLPRAELEALIDRLFANLTDLRRVATEQREAIARLKGHKGRPSIKPGKRSGMDNATKAKPSRDGKLRGRGKFVIVTTHSLG